jgi:UDP-2,4-diacetamido-2,4,6-trideoxy-beta-L-altropyranose hydrolase
LKTKVYIRTDGNSQIGLGHVIRCTALADMLREDFSCIFLIQKPNDFLISEIRNAGADIIEIPVTNNYTEEAGRIAEKFIQNKDIVILDGYKFETGYQKIIKNKGCKLVCIDDIHAYHFVADVVINHIIGKSKENYSCEPYTKLYLGTDYALLRKEFLNEASNNRDFKEIETILINMGGADESNATQKVLENCFDELPDKKYNVIVGAYYLHSNSLNKYAAGHSKINVFQNVKPEELSILIKESQLCICPSSSISYEIFCIGNLVICGYISESQKDIVELLEKYTLVVNAGSFIEENIIYKPFIKKLFEKKNVYIENQNKLFNGKQEISLINIFKQFN